VNPTRPVPVLTMEELFAPVLEPEARDGAPTDAHTEPSRDATAPAPEPDLGPWSDPALWTPPAPVASPAQTEQHATFGWPQLPVPPVAEPNRAAPFRVDSEPAFDDEDPVRPAGSRPRRRELPDFDELLKPRDDD
jgi:hypothetical protein